MRDSKSLPVSKDGHNAAFFLVRRQDLKDSARKYVNKVNYRRTNAKKEHV